MVYDPIKDRKTYMEFGLGFTLNQSPGPTSPVGNYACSDLTSVVYGWLVGLDKEFSPVLPRILEWIDKALASHEEKRFGESPEFHLATLHSAKAMALWMLHGENSKADWDQARRSYEGYWQDPKGLLTERGMAIGVDDCMGYAVQAGSFEAGIEVYERYMNNVEPVLSKTLKPREFGYALCLHAVHNRYSREELLAAGRKMLRANLENDWLDRGHSSTAAMWLKIVHWDRDRSLSPLEVIKMAYSDMPKVTRPDFV